MNKKIMSAALVALLAAGCAGSGTAAGGAKNGSSSGTTSEDAYYVFTSDVKTIDQMTSQNAGDGVITGNTIEGLTTVDPYNQYIGDIAESWEHNDDMTEWTFKLRDGATWVTNTGEEYAAVTPSDFETGLQHIADFQGPTLSIAEMFVKGLTEYATGTDTNWDDVGVEADDDAGTVKYTLTEPTPYFASVASYTPFKPINKDFLEEQGTGCKLGAPDASQCSYGTPTDAASILYNGPYILDEFISKSSIKMHKNPSYWDADHVYINNINLVYDDGSDPASTVKGFQRDENPYYMALLYTTAKDFQSYLDQYKDNAYTGPQNQYTFGINFNLNRVTYDKFATSGKTDDKSRADAREALLNANFRKALKFGLDRSAYMASIMDESIADSAIRNIECPWNFVTTSDGKNYGELVQEASEDPSVDLSEGQDSYYNPDKAKEAIEAAKKELPDVTWPVHLDLLDEDGDASNIAQASSLKQSIEASVGTDNIVIDVHPVDEDSYVNSSYNSNGPEDADWDISTSTGWGYDYVDPRSYLNIFSPVNGDILRQNMGLEFKGSADSNQQNEDAIEKSGLNEYQSLLDEAYAITDDLDARYAAEAKAEAYLLDNALFVPVNTQARAVNWRISRETPFLGGYLQQDTYKWRVINKDPITAEEYKTALTKWQEDSKKAAENAAN